MRGLRLDIPFSVFLGFYLDTISNRKWLLLLVLCLLLSKNVSKELRFVSLYEETPWSSYTSLIFPTHCFSRFSEELKGITYQYNPCTPFTLGSSGQCKNALVWLEIISLQTSSLLNAPGFH